MSPQWECTQCRALFSKGLIAGFEGAPDECDNCGNDEFTQVSTTGIHRVADDPGGVAREQVTRRRVVGGGVVALGAVGLGWYLQEPQIAETSDVSLRNQVFVPPNIHIESGTTVTWSNDDDPTTAQDRDPHTYTLVSGTAGWDFEEQVPPDESVSHTFDESGEYRVYTEEFADFGMEMKIGVDREIEEPVQN